jgi:GNAT superfamily N-acetyltransferase
METELEIRMADADDINTIAYLAQLIWPITYREILSQDQLEYMLRLIYSPEALKNQMNNQHQFLIAELNEDPVGFASYSAINEQEGIFKLHKLYVLPEFHGKGLGKAILDFIAEEILAHGATRLYLNMNRQNKARRFYEKYGFNIIKEEDVDIGNNYFMNDYVMEKRFSV